MKKAIFLDRDGTINKDMGHLFKREDLEFIEGSLLAMKKLQEKYELFVITNQCGIGDGFFSGEEYAGFNGWFLESLEKEGIRINEVCHCPHSKSVECGCRKPSPYFINKLAAEYDIDLKNSYMIGDHPHDVESGMRAGTKTIYLLSGHGVKHVRELDLKPDFVAEDLLEASFFILM